MPLLESATFSVRPSQSRKANEPWRCTTTTSMVLVRRLVVELQMRKRGLHVRNWSTLACRESVCTVRWTPVRVENFLWFSVFLVRWVHESGPNRPRLHGQSDPRVRGCTRLFMEKQTRSGTWQNMFSQILFFSLHFICHWHFKRTPARQAHCALVDWLERPYLNRKHCLEFRSCSAIHQTGDLETSNRVSEQRSRLIKLGSSVRSTEALSSGECWCDALLSPAHLESRQCRTIRIVEWTA